MRAQNSSREADGSSRMICWERANIASNISEVTGSFRGFGAPQLRRWASTSASSGCQVLPLLSANNGAETPLCTSR